MEKGQKVQFEIRSTEFIEKPYLSLKTAFSAIRNEIKGQAVWLYTETGFCPKVTTRAIQTRCNLSCQWLAMIAILLQI